MGVKNDAEKKNAMTVSPNAVVLMRLCASKIKITTRTTNKSSTRVNPRVGANPPQKKKHTSLTRKALEYADFANGT